MVSRGQTFPGCAFELCLLSCVSPRGSLGWQAGRPMPSSPGGQTTRGLPQVSELTPPWAASAPRGDQSASLLAGAAAGTCVGCRGRQRGAVPHGLHPRLPRALLSICFWKFVRNAFHAEACPHPISSCWSSRISPFWSLGYRGHACACWPPWSPHSGCRHILVTVQDPVFKPDVFVTMVFCLPFCSKLSSLSRDHLKAHH